MNISDNIYEGNEGERKKSLYRRNLILLFLSGIVLLYVALPTTFTDNKTYVNIVEMINLLLKLSMFISVIIAYKIYHKTVFIYLEIILGVISVINIVFLIALVKGGGALNDIPNVCYMFKFIIDCIAYTSAITFSILLKSTVTNKVLKRVQIIYGVIPLMLVVIIQFKGRYFNSYNTMKLENIMYYGQLAFLAMLFACLVIIYKNSNKLQNKGFFKKLIVADVLFMISHILSLNFIPLIHYLHRCNYIFSLLGTAIICQVVIEATLQNQLEKLYRSISEKNCEIENLKYLYRSVFEFMSDGIIIRDGGNIIFANNSMVEMTRAVSDEKFKGFNVVKLIGSKYIERFNQYNKLVLEGKKVNGITEEIVCFDGNKIMVEVSCTKIVMAGKSMILSIVKNISNQMKAEQNEKELIAARNKDKLRGEFFANISHELRTPINVIYSSLQVMQMHMEKDNINNDKIDCYMKVIKQNCYRLLRIISNLIDITKIEAGFLKPNMSRREIVSLIENISMSIVTYLHQKDMELVFDTDIEEKYVECDADMMERVMLNLFSNAVKFRKSNGHVWVNIHDTKDGSVTIEVKDDGIGIPEEKQKLIFKRFTQVDSSLIRRSKGSGIGLSLVKSIIEMNSGSIRFESKEDVGTKFIIKLPSERNEIMHEYSDVKAISDSGIDNTKEKVNIEFADI